MARRKRRAIQKPLKKPRRRVSSTSRLETFFRRHPLLRAAFKRARERFEDLPGVCGVGIGLPYSEKEGVYRKGLDDLDGLSIKVYVQAKKDRLPRRQRIPKWMTIEAPGQGSRKRRIPIDVVQAGAGTSNGADAARMSSGRGWPTADQVTPGRLFAYGLDPATATPPQLDPDRVELGTTGALLRLARQRLYAVTAGHVFTEPCTNDYDAPEGKRAMSAKGRAWKPVLADEFFPGTIRSGSRVRDAMSFRVPAGFEPADASWPDGFQKELATSEDIDRAIKSKDPTGFIWVERQGRARPLAIPVDLEAAIPFFKAPVKCNGTTVDIPYLLTWPLRFTSELNTLGGDSGAGVFLWTEQNSFCRLLGFHFLEWGGRSYAMDAREFFQEVFSATPGNGFEFA